MRLFLSATIVVLLFQSVAVAQDPDLKKLQGAWKVMSLNLNGKEAPPMPDSDVKFVIKGDKMVVRVTGVPDNTAAIIKLDSTKTPKHIDTTENGETKDGVYSLDGDEFVLCMPVGSKDRPTKTEPAKGVMMFKMKRVKE